jgi:DNA invertase Pin-like site-specific DNA recombinase
MRRSRAARSPYFEEVERGTKIKNRPKLAEAISLTRKTKGVLVIAKLDRLARNVAFVSALMESKIEFVALDFPQADRFTIHLLAAFAEFEAKRISDRTKTALAQARLRGVKLGSPRCRETIHACRLKGQTAIKAVADQRAANLLPIIRDIVASGARSHAAVARALEQRTVATPRGSYQWQGGQVQTALARCGVSLVDLIAQVSQVSKAA